MYIKPNPPKFLELLEEVYHDEGVEKEKQKTNIVRYYPSSASFKKPDGTVVGACLRQLFYRASNEPETDAKELTTKLQGDFGNGIHDILLKKLSKSKRIKITPEASGRIKLDGLDNEISFRLDGLVNYQAERGGLEIKTVQSFAVQKMVKESGPRDSYLLQILSYFLTDDTLKWFSLILFGRDTAYRAEYLIYKDEQGRYLLEGVFPRKAPKVIEFNEEGIVARWKELEQHLKNKTVPQRDYKAVLSKEGNFVEKRVKNYVDYKSDVACRYCEYRTKCWSLPDAKDHAYKVPGD